MHRLAHTIADLNIGHCVELTFFKSRNYFQALEGPFQDTIHVTKVII